MIGIVEIAKRSNQYIANLDNNIIKSIERNKRLMIEANQDQFIKHKDADGSPLIHKNTGSSNLSPAYAKKTGKRKPDFFESGDFFDKMIFIMPDVNNYIINSKSFVSRFLNMNYGKIFGISPKNQPKTQKTNDKKIVDDYFDAIL